MPHIHEKIDFTVEAFIVYQNKVLIRKHDKYHKWLSVGGHIELDETPEVALLREIKEEVGLTVTLVPPREMPKSSKGENPDYLELIPPWYMNIHPINQTHSHNSLIYFAKSESDEVVPENEADEWKWLSREEIEKNEIGLSDSVRFYALEALKACKT